MAEISQLPLGNTALPVSRPQVLETIGEGWLNRTFDNAPLLYRSEGLNCLLRLLNPLRLPEPTFLVPGVPWFTLFLVNLHLGRDELGPFLPHEHVQVVGLAVLGLKVGACEVEVSFKLGKALLVDLDQLQLQHDVVLGFYPDPMDG